jgi:hypothetical protein
LSGKQIYMAMNICTIKMYHYNLEVLGESYGNPLLSTWSMATIISFSVVLVHLGA